MVAVSEFRYNVEPQFKALRDQGITYAQYSSDPDYYMEKLSKTSIMDLYNKGKQDYAKYTELYNQQNNLFIQLNNQKNQKFQKYNELLTIYSNRNGTGEATSADRRSAVLNSGYTTDLIRTTTDAEIMTNVYLSQRQNAVDTQRRGILS